MELVAKPKQGFLFKRVVARKRQAVATQNSLLDLTQCAGIAAGEERADVDWKVNNFCFMLYNKDRNI